MQWKLVVLLSLLICHANVAMWECYCIAAASTIASFKGTVVSILSLNRTVSVVTPVAANTAFPLATVLDTYTGADVTNVGNIILPNNLLL